MNNRLKVDLPSTLLRYLPPLLLAAITAIIYHPSLHYEFQFDDVTNITKHFNIRHYTFSDLFFSGSRWISYWINSVHYKMGGFNPYGYRIFNVGLHTANGLLIFFILAWALARTAQDSFFARNAKLIAFTTALLFLMHPVQTQTVSYVIQGQLEGLALFFILVMIGLFLHATTATGWQSRASLLGLFMVAPFSCCTKEIAIISPALLLLIDWFFVAQGNWKSLKSRILIHAAFAALIGSIYLYLLKPGFFTQIIGLERTAVNNAGNVITQSPKDLITPGIFFISQFKVIVHYLWIFLCPIGISVEYDWMLCKSFFSLDCLVPLIILVGIAILTYRLLKKNRTSIAAFGLLWFFICIVPRSSIIPSPELLTDYKTYMASCGWLLLIACACIKTVQIFAATITVQAARRPFVQAVVVLFLALPLGLLTIERNKVWRSGVEFWADIVAHAPGKARGYNNYGVELSQIQKKYKESIPYFEKAASLDPNYADAYNNLAVVYAALDEIDRGIAVLQKSLRINPMYPEGYNNLAAFLLRKKEYEQAEKMITRALTLRPHYGKAYFNLGRVYWDKGEQEKALEHFKHACTKADLDTDFGFFNYGNACFALKKYEDALWAYKRTIALNPAYPEAAFNLGNTHFYLKQFDQAIAAYQMAVTHNPQEARAWFNLGESYFVTNKIDKALDCYLKFAANGKALPQAILRIAACYEKKGNPTQAYRTLAAYTEKNIPENVKGMVRDLMGQLKQNYAIS